MNMQAMLKQAQKLQNDMLKEKKKIDETLFEGTSSLVTVKVYGSKKVDSVVVKEEALDDVEMLQDMIVIALNNAMEQIDKELDEKMGKYTKGMPGLF